MSFTVWAYCYDAAPFHDNELTDDTVNSLDEAADLARKRTRETPHNTGYAKIIDNDLRGKMGDCGLMATFKKDRNGRVFPANIRYGYEQQIRAKRAS